MRHSLPRSAWPPADLALFDGLYRQGSILDGQGPLVRQRIATRQTQAFAYACWLGWLQSRMPDALQEPPLARATPARLHQWMSERDDISPVSRASLMAAALTPLFASAPDHDWFDHRRLIDRLQARANRHSSTRKTGRIRTSGELLQLGLSLAAEGAGATPSGFVEARSRRDGAMVALLSLIPARRQAMCNLELGRHIDLRPPFRITIPPELSKTGTIWTSTLPDILFPVLEDYLRFVRPFFAGRAKVPDPALWLNDQGKRLAPNTMTGRITSVTQRLLKVAVSPHLFRDAAVTTVVMESPVHARITRDLLGHKSFDMVDRHYNHAKMIDASRLYGQCILARKPKRRPE